MNIAGEFIHCYLKHSEPSFLPIVSSKLPCSFVCGCTLFSLSGGESPAGGHQRILCSSSGLHSRNDQEVHMCAWIG
jgi:hypothetical protein